jgi:thiol-disulfide isomerase/thioredoxin
MRRTLPFALLLIVLATVVAACTRDDGRITGVVPEDEALPAIEEAALDGSIVSTQDLVGAPAVVNVWATWCAPCEAELPALVDVASAYDGRVGFLGVNFTDDAAQARTWERDYAIPYPSIDDGAGALADDLEFPYLPHTLVVDADGTIRYRIYGETTADELSGLLDGLLAEGGAAGS